MPSAGGGPERIQLDLFLDGREVLLVNRVVDGLLEGRAAAAREALGRLREENPEHPDLAGLDRLCEALGTGPPGPSSPPDVTALIERLAVLVPTAERLLGGGSRGFLLPWWRALAGAAAGLASADPDPLCRYWVGLARHHLGDEHEAVRLWLALTWLDPDSFARWAPALPSAVVREAWAAFRAEPGPGDPEAGSAGSVRWFPAWLALRHRWVAHLFHGGEVPATEPPLRALRLLPRLLVLEPEGYSAELVQQRRLLREISPTFFRAYWRAVIEGRPQN